MLEAALENGEKKAREVGRAAAALTREIRKVEMVLKQGRLRDWPRAVGNAEKSLQELERQVAELKALEFDAILASGQLLNEIRQLGQEQGLAITERDGRLYCFPVIVRMDGDVLRLDRKVETRLRPSVVVGELRKVSGKPGRFASQDFLKALAHAYDKLKPANAGDAPVVSLVEIHRLLTLLPGSSENYSRDQFARDLYLLESRAENNNLPWRIELIRASTASRAPSRVLRVVTEEGTDIPLYGIKLRPITTGRRGNRAD